MNGRTTYTLGEIDMYSVIIYQYALHFEICLLAILLILKLYECILQAVTGPLVSNNFARDDSAEPGED